MKRAVILAGGEGTRLRPYTTVLPKPLMPIGDRPVLDIVVRQLKAHGFERITIATGYLAELIEAFFRDGEAYGIPIDYYREHEPLGTVGALALIEGLADEDMLVMNGDVLTDIDYGALLERHRASDAAATIATKVRQVQISLGVLRFGDDGDPTRLTGYDEKPHDRLHGEHGRVLLRSARALATSTPDERLDFPDLILRLIAAGEIVRAWPSEDYWLDIGRHDDYEQAQEEFESVRDRLIPPEPQGLDRLRGALQRRADGRRRRFPPRLVHRRAQRQRAVAVGRLGRARQPAGGREAAVLGERVQRRVPRRLDAVVFELRRGSGRASARSASSTGKAKCEERSTACSSKASSTPGISASRSR